jgi:hypothetical protein
MVLIHEAAKRGDWATVSDLLGHIHSLPLTVTLEDASSSRPPLSDVNINSVDDVSRKRKEISLFESEQ